MARTCRCAILSGFSMIWLRLRSLFSTQLSTSTGRCFIWIAVGLSTCGTILVQVPFLLHLAGTSDWQRLSVLGLGFGIVIASATFLFIRRRDIFPTRACLVAVDAAYLATPHSVWLSIAMRQEPSGQGRAGCSRW